MRRSPCRLARDSLPRRLLREGTDAGSPRCQEQAKDRSGKQELELRRESARAVPAAAAVEELPSTRAQQREQVLEVRCRSRKRTEGGRIERAAPRREGRWTRARFLSRSGGWRCPRAGCGLRRGGARVQAAARADAYRRVPQPPHQRQHAEKRSLLDDYLITAVRVAATLRARRQPVACSRGSSCPLGMAG